jgi:hypothetical protein
MNSTPRKSRFSCWLLVALVIAIAGCKDNSKRVESDYSNTNAVSITFDEPVKEMGLNLVEPERKHRGTSDTRDGIQCRRFRYPEEAEGYVYFRISPSFKAQGLTNVTVTLEYFDAHSGSFDIEYDGRRGDTPDRSEKGEVGLVAYMHGEYTLSKERVNLQLSKSWERATFVLEDVRFKNSQNGNADFRLRVLADEILLRKLIVDKE